MNDKQARKNCEEVTHCKGHRPSQYINKLYICDNVYDCIDRSDEFNCKQRRNVQGFATFPGERQLHPSIPKLFVFMGWEVVDFHSLFVADLFHKSWSKIILDIRLYALAK